MAAAGGNTDLVVVTPGEQVLPPAQSSALSSSSCGSLDQRLNNDPQTVLSGVYVGRQPGVDVSMPQSVFELRNNSTPVCAVRGVCGVKVILWLVESSSL